VAYGAFDPTNPQHSTNTAPVLPPFIDNKYESGRLTSEVRIRCCGCTGCGSPCYCWVSAPCQMRLFCACMYAPALLCQVLCSWHVHLHAHGPFSTGRGQQAAAHSLRCSGQQLTAPAVWLQMDMYSSEHYGDVPAPGDGLYKQQSQAQQQAQQYDMQYSAHNPYADAYTQQYQPS
jgi:hypothetical protein